ncbi:MAG: hypothetical protein H6696_08420 [Deferribacteres bacterium]|nr:hypothetical protein [candidate division KSB1 bacterium]MCB9501947.1 hypothetical protein [Deferribacteres bacterium]
MIGPVEISDAIGKTHAAERVQQSDKIAEDANQKQAHAAVENLHKKAMNDAPPTGKNEDIENSLRDDKEKNMRRRKRLKKRKKPDKDEQEMTHLGHTIDILG